MARPLLLILLLCVAFGLWLIVRRRLARRDRIIGLIFVLSGAVALFFAVKLVGALIFWSDPVLHPVTPEAWMSPRYIEHSWNLPPRTLAPLIGVAPEEIGRRSLAEIARLQDEPVADLIARIEASLPPHPGLGAPR